MTEKCAYDTNDCKNPAEFLLISSILPEDKLTAYYCKEHTHEFVDCLTGQDSNVTISPLDEEGMEDKKLQRELEAEDIQREADANNGNITEYPEDDPYE